MLDKPSLKIHFPGLNGIRAIAALIVIFFHINHNLGLFNVKPIGYFVLREETSRDAVILFLVLSGYLITYLLLEEKSRFGQIALKKFYIRRILRIWPLYYTIIIISILILLIGHNQSSIHETWKAIGLYSIFLSNFAMAYGLAPLTIAPLWSLGIEEQFYLFWPLLISKVANVKRTLWLFLVIYIFLKFLLRNVVNMPFAAGTLNLFAFDTMAIGGLMSYFYFTRASLLKLLYHPLLQASCWLYFLLSLTRGHIYLVDYLDKDVYGFVFGVIILNVSTNKNTLISLENRFFNFLGKISFGFYIYHMTIISVLAPLLAPYFSVQGSRFLKMVLIQTIIIVTTLGISYISYHYFELKFIKLKKRFTNIASSD